jgi:small-conductance mechanosensitive channel
MKILNDISPEWLNVVLIIIIIISTIIVLKVVRWVITKTFDDSSSKIIVDKTKYRFLKNAASLIIWMMSFGAMILLVPKLKALAITLFAGAGIFMAIMGFAAQQAFSNIISGIFIVIFKPFRVGDMIQVGAMKYGIVEDITLRHTVINSFENKRIIIPNSVISSETITNDSIEDSKVCRWIEIGISYDSDIDLAIGIMREEAEKHPRCIDNRSEKDKKSNIPQVVVRVMSFQDSSVLLRAYVWTNDPRYAIEMHSDLNKAVKKRFDAEGIEIPFPHRTLVYKKDKHANEKGEDI